jgi:serine/alanine adding enzyme
MKVSILADDIGEWDDYVFRHPMASNYHQSAWRPVIEQCFGHKTQYLVASHGDGISGVLPLVMMKSLLFGRFLVSLPFFNYGGVLSDDSSSTEALLGSAQAFGMRENVSHMELRHRIPNGFGLRARHNKVTMILDLESSVEEQWDGFDPKLRNQVRRGEKEGLQVQLGGQELLDAFYGVFARNMRDLGTPVYGLPFFKAIVMKFPTSSRIFIVRQGGQPVAAGIGLTFRDVIEMPWAASLREYRKLCGNMLLYWAAIKFAIEGGCEKFDFGRSTLGSGTYKFKEQWGARCVPLVWEYWTKSETLPDVSPQNPKYELAIQIWKRLPIGLTNRLGPLIVRNIP